MDIAQYHTTLPRSEQKPGGAEVAVHRLANALVQQGHEVTVYSSTPAPEAHRYEHTHLWAGRSRMHRNQAMRSLALPLLLNRVPFDRHDVLHLHGDDWFFVSRDLPTVRTFHGSALEEARSADSWKRSLDQLRVYGLERLSNRLATLSAAVSPPTAQLYNTPHCVGNGVCLDRFHPGPNTSHPSVLFVGTWEGRKRGRFLYRSFLQDVLPEVPDATLYMVSDRCPEHEQVEWVSRPTDAELAALYRKAWVFAFPSRYEGFGIPYLEAMASGTAVLSSPNDGAEYVLEEGAYGVVCDDDAFGHQLARLIRDDDLRRTWAARGRERAQEFSWTQIAHRHEALYQKALAHDAAPE